MKAHTGWLYLLCADCGKRLDPEKAQNPFPGCYLCDDCTDDLFLTPATVNQVVHQ